MIALAFFNFFSAVLYEKVSQIRDMFFLDLQFPIWNWQLD